MIAGKGGFALQIFRKMSSRCDRYVGTTKRGLTKEFSFPVPWGQVSGKTWGDEKDPPILCLHGWLDNCNTFDKLIPLLPQRRFYVTFDMPGHGLSSHISHGMRYSTIFYCSVLKRILDYFKFKRITMMGHSMGGNVATYFGGVYPDIVHTIISIDTVGVWFRKKEDLVTALRSCLDSYHAFEEAEPRPEKQYSYEDAKKRLQIANSKLTEEAVEILLERGMKEEENGQFTFRRDIRHLYKDALERSLDVALEFVSNIKADVMFVWAKDGLIKVVRQDHAQVIDTVLKAYKEHAKSFKLVNLDGNHHGHLCTPEETARHIMEFLESLDVSRSGTEDGSNL